MQRVLNHIFRRDEKLFAVVLHFCTSSIMLSSRALLIRIHYIFFLIPHKILLQNPPRANLELQLRLDQVPCNVTTLLEKSHFSANSRPLLLNISTLTHVTLRLSSLVQEESFLTKFNFIVIRKLLL
jgi:hypothetical protein